MIDILQYIGTGMGVFYVTLISFWPKHIRIGLKLSVVSCIVLSAWGLLTHQYGIMISQSIYTVLNIIAIYKWGKVNVTSN